MEFLPLVEEYRGGLLENVHFGAISIVDERGKILYGVGDPERMTYLRSAAKAFQAMPAIKRGVQDAFGLSDRETALFMASHRGESYHIDSLEAILHKAGIEEESLHCGSTYPLNEEAKAARYRAGDEKRKIFHNCSGKHSGMIAVCRLEGWDEASYYEPEHPLQKEIIQTVSELTGLAPEDIPLGIDGCGLPVFALPLDKIAWSYLKLACPDLIEDAPTSEAAARMGRLANDNPEMIADRHFVCTELLKDDNLFAKGGAKGVYAIGLRKERLGIALKVSDGSEQVWPCIIATILEKIGYDNSDTIDRLYKLVPNEIVNDAGEQVGERRAVFEMVK